MIYFILKASVLGLLFCFFLVLVLLFKHTSAGLRSTCVCVSRSASASWCCTRRQSCPGGRRCPGTVPHQHGATPARCLHAGTAGAPGGPGFCPEPSGMSTAQLQNTARGDGWHSLSQVINGCGEIAPWRKQDPKGTGRDVQSMWEIEIAALAPK